MNRKIQHLTSEIDRGVREVLARGLHDPRIQGLITVTGVRVLEDLSRAYINISVLPAEKQELTFHGISGAAAHIRREVGDLVQTRQLPQFEFRLDTSLKKQATLLQAIDRAKAELKEISPPASPEPGEEAKP